ncbi:hypothetical protein F5X98DRAFT_356517 [Xylaria grammica]|nr:hypothetical protein F5X98DRAFT_356517 [Xylaria grammica]
MSSPLFIVAVTAAVLIQDSANIPTTPIGTPTWDVGGPGANPITRNKPLHDQYRMALFHPAHPAHPAHPDGGMLGTALRSSLCTTDLQCAVSYSFNMSNKTSRDFSAMEKFLFRSMPFDSHRLLHGKTFAPGYHRTMLSKLNQWLPGEANEYAN